MDFLHKLNAMRATGGAVTTVGLPDDVLIRFGRMDPNLARAVGDAHALYEVLREEFPDVITMAESEQVRAIQARFVNFYADDAVNPYVALGGSGPWVVTSKGAVLHDSGGYGMLGLGHAPEAVLNAMNRRQVMANVMTASFSQLRLTNALVREIGHTRDACPFARFLCLNSGSESVTMAGRLADVNAKLMTDPGGRHAGKPIRRLSLKGGFHGRTDRPSQYSSSTLDRYVQHLASFRDKGRLVTVAPNDVAGLHEAFERAEREGYFFEGVFMEPVMGEGNPGCAITREFYDAARRLSREHGTLLLIDSIQAGLRAHGCLSIVDYPGFEDADPPDMETFSKALNGGQYPLSVLAMTGHAAGLYRKGVYGNTMTSNPRAMEVACAVLGSITPELRHNIVERGREFLVKLQALADELDGAITHVQGTGLLLSCALDSAYRCYGADSTEAYMRRHGIGVIHGGENSLRFTPHFRITSEEIDLIVAATRDALVHGPRRETAGERDVAVGI